MHARGFYFTRRLSGVVERPGERETRAHVVNLRQFNTVINSDSLNIADFCESMGNLSMQKFHRDTRDMRKNRKKTFKIQYFAILNEPIMSLGRHFLI